MAMAGTLKGGSVGAATSNKDDCNRIHGEIENAHSTLQQGFKRIDRAVNAVMQRANYWAVLEMVRWGVPVFMLYSSTLAVQRSETYATDQGTKFWGNVSCFVVGGASVVGSLVYVFHREQGQPQLSNLVAYISVLFVVGIVITLVARVWTPWTVGSRDMDSWGEWLADILKRFVNNLGSFLLMVVFHFSLLLIGPFTCPRLKSSKGIVCSTFVLFSLGFVITLPLLVAECEVVEDFPPSLIYYSTVVVAYLALPFYVFAQAALYWGVKVQSWGHDVAATRSMKVEAEKARFLHTEKSEDSCKNALHAIHGQKQMTPAVSYPMTVAVSEAV